MAKLKDHPENSDEGKADKASAEQADSANAEQVQEKMDVETEQGFRGVEVDQVPNEAYTLKGVTSGMGTPETDDEAAAVAAAGRKAAETKAAGVGGR